MRSSGIRSVYTPWTQAETPARAATTASSVEPMCATDRTPCRVAASTIAFARASSSFGAVKIGPAVNRCGPSLLPAATAARSSKASLSRSPGSNTEVTRRTR